MKLENYGVREFKIKLPGHVGYMIVAATTKAEAVEQAKKIDAQLKRTGSAMRNEATVVKV